MTETQTELIESILYHYFGSDYKLKCYSDTYHYWCYDCGDYRVDIHARKGLYLFSIDLSCSFDKESKSPIHFVLDPEKNFSKRRSDRIFSALNYLKINKKDAGSFFGKLPGYDDLAAWVMDSFYGR